MTRIACITVTLLVPCAVTTAKAECIPAATPDQVIEGRLIATPSEHSPGEPVRAFIVVLPSATCLTGRDRVDQVDEVAMMQIFSRDEMIGRRMAELVGKDVTVHGSAFPGLGAYHQAPVLMSVTRIERAYAADERRTMGLGDACTFAGCDPDQGPISERAARQLARSERQAHSAGGEPQAESASRLAPCVVGAGRARPSYAMGREPTVQQLVETWRASNVGIPGRRIDKEQFEIMDWSVVGGRQARAFLQFRILSDKGGALDFARDRCVGRTRPVEVQVYYQFSREVGAWVPDDVRGESSGGLCSRERLWTAEEIEHLLAPGSPVRAGNVERASETGYAAAHVTPGKRGPFGGGGDGAAGSCSSPGS
jgi:hypothetical protein